MISVLSDYPINSVNTDEALSLLQYYLSEVAKYYHVLEYFTNNILASLMNQL